MREVLDFWFSDGPGTPRKAWFVRDDAFDDAIRQRFAALLAPAREGVLDGWADTAEGALALLLVLDQFPRNLHRGTPLAFAFDARAREVARRAVLGRRQDQALTPTQRVFLYLPFEHSEAMADQDLSVALFEGLRDSPPHRMPGGAIDYAWQHRRVIRRFGRFPHRNAALGRPSTPAEQAYLAQPGAGF
ncbi:DUF924 family protein [Roseococcus sp. DSY-14]|uniref:DUF924 family protein n=1 Tax=Roseococcus sp. DSY-14 TaxID=3369650 RepID=UPI00387AE9EE